MASEGLLSLPAGIALALGANIGTCVTRPDDGPRQAHRSSAGGHGACTIQCPRDAAMARFHRDPGGDGDMDLPGQPAVGGHRPGGGGSAAPDRQCQVTLLI